MNCLIQNTEIRRYRDRSCWRRCRIDPHADARLTHLKICTNPAMAMVREEQTGSVISQQLGQFGVSADMSMLTKTRQRAVPQ